MGPATPEIYTTIAIAWNNRWVMGCSVLSSVLTLVIGLTIVITLQEIVHKIIHAITIVE